MYYTGMAYPAYPAEAAYYGGAYPAYGYYAPPPRGIPPPRGGRFIAGGGRGMFLQGVPGGQAGEPSGMQVRTPAQQPTPQQAPLPRRQVASQGPHHPPSSGWLHLRPGLASTRH